MAVLDQYVAVRDAILAALLAKPDATAYDTYSLDGESWSLGNWADKLAKLNDLILFEQNRVNGRREMRMVRGRWRGSLLWR